MPPNTPACLDQRSREFEEGKEKGDASKGKESSLRRRLNPINRRCQMFDSRHTSTEPNDTLFNPDSTNDVDPRLRRTASRRWRAAGRGRNAGPRDPRSSRLTGPIRRGRLNRERGGFQRVNGEGIERGLTPFANPMS